MLKQVLEFLLPLVPWALVITAVVAAALLWRRPRLLAAILGGLFLLPFLGAMLLEKLIPPLPHHDSIVSDEASPGGKFIVTQFTRDFDSLPAGKRTWLAIRRSGEEFHFGRTHVFLEASGEGSVKAQWAAEDNLVVELTNVEVMNDEPRWESVTFIYRQH